MAYCQVAELMDLDVSHATICDAMEVEGFERCVACVQPILTKTQLAARL
jgi:hypothetical protein